MNTFTASDYLLNDAQQSLERVVVAGQGSNFPLDAFIGWLLPSRTGTFRSLPDVAIEAAHQIATARTYQLVAALGFAAARNCLPQVSEPILREELDRLIGREPFVNGNAMPFCTDVVSLLGLSFAAVSLRDAALETKFWDWTQRFVPRCVNMSGIADWERCFYVAVQTLVGRKSDLSVPTAIDVAPVRLALHSEGCFGGKYVDSETDHLHVLRALSDNQMNAIDSLQAALWLKSLEWIRRSSPAVVPNRIAVPDVANLLRGVESALRYWTWESAPRTRGANAVARQWNIDHEYHAQNMVGFLLQPFLPDLTPEENMPSIAHKRPRADLYVPSLKLVIEMKFIYSGDRFQKIIDEIAADTSLYMAAEAICQHIIAFIWDESRRNSDHAFLRNGLLKLNGIRDVILVSKPGQWN